MTQTSCPGPPPLTFCQIACDNKNMAPAIAQIGKSFSGGLRVDRATGTIYNVKILGFDSENNRRYLPEAVKAAKSLYEGIKVNLDHPDGDPNQPRKAEDRIGKLTNVRYVEGKGLFGNLQLLMSRPMAKSICEAAEKMPDAYGLSHNAQGEGEEDKDGILVIRRITDVRHVDLVADPATTKSLAESVQRAKRKIAIKEGEGTMLSDKINEILNGDMDDASKLDAIKMACENYADDEDSQMEMDDKSAMEADGEDMPSEDEKKKDMEEADGADSEDPEKKKKTEEEDYGTNTKESVSSLRRRMGKLERELTESKKIHKIRNICESHGLKVSVELVEDLKYLPEEAQKRHVKRLVEAQRAMKPRSGSPLMEAAEPRKGESLASYLLS